MHKPFARKIFCLLLLGVVGRCFAADMSVQLNTADGSTKFSIQNSAAVEVGSVDSLGNAAFTKVTESGATKSFISNQNALQSGATFYVSSGTATNFNTNTLKFADGTTQTTASQGGTITGVTAGYGVNGGGLSGNVTVNLVSNATAYIQNTNALQSGATFYISSGTAANFNTTTLKFADGTTQTTAGTINGVTAGLGLTGSGTSGNITLSLASNSTNYIQNTSALQSGTTFYVSSGTVSGPLTVGGVLIAGTGANQITTTAGLLDATKVVGNIPGNAASITGTMNPNQINAGSLAGTVIASSIAVSAVQDASIVAVSASKLTGTISNASIDASSVTKQGNAFNAANQLVQLNASGNIPLPSGAHITVGALQGTIVPSGTLILTTSTCPSGFTEYTAAGGFYLVGVPSGGTVGGTVGSAMTDLANATHNHTITATPGMDGDALTGNVSVVTSVTTPTGSVSRGTIAPYFQIRLCSVP